MSTMKHYNLIIITILAAVGFVFIFFFFQNKETILPPGGSATGELYSVTIIEESFQNSVHTLSGVVVVPTPCHQVTVSDVLVAESYPEQVRISLSVITGSDVCAQVITEKPFAVTFTGSKEAMVTFLVNNQTVRPEYFQNSEASSPSKNDSFDGADNVPAIVQ